MHIGVGECTSACAENAMSGLACAPSVSAAWLLRLGFFWALLSCNHVPMLGLTIVMPLNRLAEEKGKEKKACVIPWFDKM